MANLHQVRSEPHYTLERQQALYLYRVEPRRRRPSNRDLEKFRPDHRQTLCIPPKTECGYSMHRSVHATSHEHMLVKPRIGVPPPLPVYP